MDWNFFVGGMAAIFVLMLVFDHLQTSLMKRNYLKAKIVNMTLRKHEALMKLLNAYEN